MTPRLLAELTRLFEAEASEADLRGHGDEADRLWDIAAEIYERFLKAKT